MDLQSVLEEAAYLCVSAAIVIFLFKAGRRMKKAERDLEQLERTLEENRPDDVNND